MLAPPPTIATAARFAPRNPIALQISSTVAEESVQRSGDKLVEFVRDSWKSAPEPVEMVATVAVDSCSLARRHSPSRRVSDPDSRGAGEAAGGVGIGGACPHVIEDELIDRVAGEIGVPDRRADLLQSSPRHWSA